MIIKRVGLCDARHPIPQVTEYIFEREINPLDIPFMNTTALDFLLNYLEEQNVGDDPVFDQVCVELYVTGLSVAIVAVINACRKLGMLLVLMHYDRVSETYYPQEVLN